MTSSSLPNSDRDDQAATWAAKLDGSTLSSAERVSLDRWLDEHPENRVCLSQYCQLSADLEHLLPAVVDSASPSLQDPRDFSPQRRIVRFRWLASSALAVASVVALAFWVAPAREDPGALATASAQRQGVRLADGSRVELNAQTNVRIEFGPDVRRVRLASGEAYFGVTPGDARPFVVETPTGSVRVTGTEFAVRTESDGTFEVLVAEGSVQVHAGDATSAPVGLRAGDRLTAQEGHHTMDTLSPDAVADALAWREGQAVFAGTPLKEALARFGRYHGLGLTASRDTAALQLGGRFSLDDLEGFLAALEQALPVKVTRGLNGVILVVPREASNR